MNGMNGMLLLCKNDQANISSSDTSSKNLKLGKQTRVSQLQFIVLTNRQLP